jgi:predicted transposase/invertase (TIGR01784 family)
MRFIDPRTDFAFKKIFGSDKSKPILISFLNALVYQGQERIKDLEIIDPYQAAKVLGLKDTYLDVKAVLDDDTKVIIEMQYEYMEGFEQRILYNCAKGYANQLVRGQRYSELNSVIALTITNFNLFKELTEVITYFEFKERNNLIDYPFSTITMIFVELPKFKKELAELNDIIDKWLYFLSKTRDLEEIPNNLEQIEPIKEALLIANRASFTPEELDTIEQQEFYRYDQQRLKEEKLKAEQQAQQAQEQAQQAQEQAQQAQEQAQQAQEQAQQAQEQAQQAQEQLQQTQQQLQQEISSKKTLLLRLLSKKFGEIDQQIQERINNLSTEKLENLTEVFLDFEDISDLISWLE